MCSKLHTSVGPLSEMTPLNTIFYFILKKKQTKKQALLRTIFFHSTAQVCLVVVD